MLNPFGLLQAVTCQTVFCRLVLECISHEIAFLSGWPRGSSIGHADGVMIVEQIVEAQLPIIDIGMRSVMGGALLPVMREGFLRIGMLEISVLTACVLHLHPEVFYVCRGEEVKATNAIVDVDLFLAEEVMIDAYQRLVVETESFAKRTDGLDADDGTHRGIVFRTR